MCFTCNKQHKRADEVENKEIIALFSEKSWKINLLIEMLSGKTKEENNCTSDISIQYIKFVVCTSIQLLFIFFLIVESKKKEIVTDAPNNDLCRLSS